MLDVIPDWLQLAYDGVELLVPLGMLPVLAYRHRSATALAWLLLLILAPLTGLAIYLFLQTYRRRHDRKRERRTREALAELLDPSHRPSRRAPDGEAGAVAALVERIGIHQLGGWPAVGGNDVELIDDSQAMLDDLTAHVERARHSVHLSFYQFDAGASARRLAQALRTAAERGVACRLLAGAYSSRFEGEGSLFRDLAAELRESGVAVVATEPISPFRGRLVRVDLRNHRKLAVVDGEVAWIGSQNIHDPDVHLERGTWKQLNARIVGPAVGQIQGVFVQDWYRHTEELLDDRRLFPEAQERGAVVAQTVWWSPSDPVITSLSVLAALVHSARERLSVATAYFVPDPALHLALCVAAQRGVEVDLVVPARSDRRIADAAARHGFEPLLEAGARIHLHRDGFLHTKCVAVDDRIALVGSANLDNRSLFLDFEACVLLYDSGITRRVHEVVAAYQKASDPVDASQWRQRSRWGRTRDALANLAAPVL